MIFFINQNFIVVNLVLREINIKSNLNSFNALWSNKIAQICKFIYS